jgi:hypothetical protein
MGSAKCAACEPRFETKHNGDEQIELRWPLLAHPSVHMKFDGNLRWLQESVIDGAMTQKP